MWSKPRAVWDVPCYCKSLCQITAQKGPDPVASESWGKEDNNYGKPGNNERGQAEETQRMQGTKQRAPRTTPPPYSVVTEGKEKPGPGTICGGEAENGLGT